jgi:hypothetical protein
LFLNWSVEQPPVLFLDYNAGFTMLYLSLAVALECDTLVDASYGILQQVTGVKGKRLPKEQLFLEAWHSEAMSFPGYIAIIRLPNWRQWS